MVVFEQIGEDLLFAVEDQKMGDGCECRRGIEASLHSLLLDLFQGEQSMSLASQTVYICKAETKLKLELATGRQDRIKNPN